MNLTRFHSLILICLFLVLGSCIGSQTARQSRYNKKQEKIMMKQMRKEYQYALKRHHEMQSESTREMMLSSQKNSKKINKERKKSLFRTSSGCKSNKPVGPIK